MKICLNYGRMRILLRTSRIRNFLILAFSSQTNTKNSKILNMTDDCTHIYLIAQVVQQFLKKEINEHAPQIFPLIRPKPNFTHQFYKSTKRHFNNRMPILDIGENFPAIKHVSRMSRKWGMSFLEFMFYAKTLNLISTIWQMCEPFFNSRKVPMYKFTKVFQFVFLFSFARSLRSKSFEKVIKIHFTQTVCGETKKYFKSPKKKTTKSIFQ